MIAFIVSSLLGMARAEEKTCVVKGMECQNCVEMVTKNVCTDAFSVCTVRLKDKKKHLGEIAMVTKDPAEKIDLKRVDAELDKLTYKIDSCVAKVKR